MTENKSSLSKIKAMNFEEKSCHFDGFVTFLLAICFLLELKNNRAFIFRYCRADVGFRGGLERR